MTQFESQINWAQLRRLFPGANGRQVAGLGSRDNWGQVLVVDGNGRWGGLFVNDLDGLHLLVDMADVVTAAMGVAASIAAALMDNLHSLDLLVATEAAAMRETMVDNWSLLVDDLNSLHLLVAMSAAMREAASVATAAQSKAAILVNDLHSLDLLVTTEAAAVREAVVNSWCLLVDDLNGLHLLVAVMHNWCFLVDHLDGLHLLMVAAVSAVHKATMTAMAALMNNLNRAHLGVSMATAAATDAIAVTAAAAATATANDACGAGGNKCGKQTHKDLRKRSEH